MLEKNGISYILSSDGYSYHLFYKKKYWLQYHRDNNRV